MYRLLSLRKTTQITYSLLSHRKINQYGGISEKYFASLASCPCLYNQNNAVVQRKLLVPVFGSTINHISSSSTVSKAYLTLQKLRKSRKKRKRNFTDTLQVTSTSTKETKTSVKNLKADKLHDFITSEAAVAALTPKNDEYQKFSTSGIIQDEEPVIFAKNSRQELSLTQKDLDNILNMYHIHKQDFPEEIDAMESELLVKPEEEEIFEDIAAETQEEPPTKKGKRSKKEVLYQSKTYKTKEDETEHKAKMLAFSLYSYVELCTAIGMINRGFSSVLHHRYKYLNKNTKEAIICNIDLYNLLLSGFAEKGNLQRVKEISSIIKEDGLQFTAQTYANILECLGRVETTPEITAEIEKVLKRATADGFTLNDIMDKPKFVSDKREIVQSAIQIIFPDFQPTYTPPAFYYNNPLVDSLNENVLDIRTEITSDTPPVEGREIMEPKQGFTKEELMEMAKEQLEIELKGYVTVKNISRQNENVTPLVLEYRKKWDEINKQWYPKICAAFQRDVNSLRSHSRAQSQFSMSLLPYLRSLDISTFANIMLREIRKLCDGSETYSATMNLLYVNLGRQVMSHFQVEQKKRKGILGKMGEIYDNYSETLANGNSSDNPRQLWQRIVHQHRQEGPSLDIIDKPWPTHYCVDVGKFLYKIILRDLQIDVHCLRKNAKTTNYLPAFYTIFRYHGALLVQEIKPNPVLIKLVRGSLPEELNFSANLVPMACPPQPWSSPNNGGYLLMKGDFLRLQKQAMQQLKRMKDANEEDLYPPIDSLNQLGSIPWTVNGDIFDVILKVFNDGGSEKLDVPQPPSALPPLPELTREEKAALTTEQKIKNFKQKLLHKRRQAEMYSLWCDALHRLSLANHFRNKVFWLPHNLDFRGRAYPLPPHLNHLGNDLARSLLVFHQKKPLGVDGFSWLKLHCINLTGLKKRSSVRERLLYAEKIMDDILDSADNPLTGRMWWTKSDEPWQTLSTCQEIAKVFRSGDPENYMSSFPIHQDGSCNGLQHYAALGRDSAGAFSVNLAPCDVPQDVYSAVAALVEEMRKRDEDTIPVAKVLAGAVTRKVIKQTVMTTVYGVTRYGARHQIARRLKELENFPQQSVWQASTYLTTKTFDSLREMFKSAKEIQDWFTECARLISTTKGENVEWCTPLGLPVVQPYSKQKKSLTKTLEGTDMYGKPNTMKQKNAFPPNFVHSLDSCHMMLTSVHCERAGLTFVSVHDCFWTHPCTVPDMNKITREQFVALHSQPILEDLSKFLAKQYSYDKTEFAMDGSISDMSKAKMNNIFSRVPKKGGFDLQKVLDSVYFFS